MTKFIIGLGFILTIFTAFSQNFKYFETKRDYIYNALYIDSIGDTITNETLIIRIPDKRWIFQPWKQKSLIYIYETDIKGYKNYIDPNAIYQEMNEDYFKKHGEFRLVQKSTSGGLVSKRNGYFYMHPPRQNQYSMLFNAAHPIFVYSALENKNDTLSVTNQKVYGKGYFKQEYIYESIGNDKFLGDSITIYQVKVSSDLISKKKYVLEEVDFYSSTLEALFCMEYGFIKMHYKFKSGVRIEFDLVEVVEND
ncbi:hypothetical protein ERX46_13880 [Brumimicrobium glaciale]|uniref:DUF3108 domain-containing protein n=1 Tax=Brumimicrobium glaciale TaxID=200475 RepID=A0A4Q4KI94_9FLAO|nr:hypothetical protein [Brumimicrobium glaciale]RYM32367.1 hypothetical protein ERX46_13880 [Brumimicrobium glaciale]